MSRFAIATSDDAGRGRLFFTGSFEILPRLGSLIPTPSTQRDETFTSGTRKIAGTIADFLTELARANDAPRTWFVLELPEQPRASVANAARAASRADAAPPQAGVRPAPPTDLGGPQRREIEGATSEAIKRGQRNA